MKLKKLFISTMLVAVAATAGAQNVLPLSLDQCIRIALSDNPTVKVDSMEIKRVDYARKLTLGQLYPQITANGQYTRNLAIQTIYMDAGDGETRAIKMGRDNTYAAGFLYAHSLGMPLKVCGEVGSIIAAKVVEVIGTKIDVPRWRDAKAEIRELIASVNQ